MGRSQGCCSASYIHRTAPMLGVTWPQTSVMLPRVRIPALFSSFPHYFLLGAKKKKRWCSLSESVSPLLIPVQFSSVTQSCLTLCDPMDYSMPGFPVHHQLPELTQTHVHRIGVTVQPSNPLLSPSPPTFNLSLHQGLSQWASSSYQVAKVLEIQLQHQSFQWIFRTSFRMDLLDLLAVQVTLKSLLQHNSSKASIL